MSTAPSAVALTWVLGLVIVGCLGTPLVRLVGVKGPLALRLSLVVGTAFLTLIAVATNLFFPERSGPTIIVPLVLSCVCQGFVPFWVETIATLDMGASGRVSGGVGCGLISHANPL